MPKRLTILVVDDQPFVALSLAEVLREQGHGVICASSAGAGLAIFSANPDIDLLIIDIGLPDRRGDVLAAQCRLLRAVSVIFISGYDSDEVEPLAHTSFVEKPFTTEDILHALGKLAGERSSPAGLAGAKTCVPRGIGKLEKASRGTPDLV
ncbi:response regulator [Alsobacter sp. SYSU BS001988]